MPQTHSLRAAFLAACSILAAAGASAQTPTATQEENPFSAAQSQAIDRMIRAYIIKHPDVLMEALSLIDAQTENRRVDVIKKVLTDNKQLIYHDPELPFIGNPKGDVIVVEFFDYNCPYCRKATPDIAKLVANDQNVKVVFQEFPNLSAASTAVSLIALAAKRQGKYYELHRALLDLTGPTNEARAYEIAAKLGLDVARLKRDVALPEVKKALASARTVVGKLNLEGTPMFLVGDRYIQGMPENFYEELTKRVAEVRAEGCKICRADKSPS